MSDSSSLSRLLQQAEIHTHSYLPIAAAYCRMIGLMDTVDQTVESRMQLSPGLTVQAMVLDVLSGRSPLYRVEQFIAQQHRELLLGEEIDPHLFNDTNIARSLDAIFEAGPSKIITQLGVQAADVFELDRTVLSYDTTSTSVWGEYRGSEQGTEAKGPAVTYGHSKDHRPDLKQFMTELLCVDRGVPIFGSTLDGNASDKQSNNAMLSRISTLMARHGLGAGACIYVADSAMVTRENLAALTQMRFISRLPATYSVCEQVIAEAVEQQWQPIGILAEHATGTHRPPAAYKAYETAVSLYDQSYRAVVIHSSAHDKRRQKKLEKAVEQSLKELTGKLKKVQVRYFCKDDAAVAAANLTALSSPLHVLKADVHEVAVRRRGRPPKEGNPPTDLRYDVHWEIRENEEKVKLLREQAGCFVLLTNVPREDENGLDAASVLRSYKGQYGIESDFSFLKDPLVVNDLFLKTPSRINALGMILIIALMIWRLMERQMRLYLRVNTSTVPGWDNKPTAKPTAFMMSTVFGGIMSAELDGESLLITELSSRQMAFLFTLGLDERVFTDKWVKCALTRKPPAA